MPEQTSLLPQFYLKIDGSDAPSDMLAAIEEIVVESSLHLPSVATLTLYDPQLTYVDSSSLALLSEIVISVKDGAGQAVKLFDGQIVELEPQLSYEKCRMVIRAYDYLHKLSRGQYSRTFLNIKDSDLVQKFAQESGLTCEAKATSEVHPHCFQANQSNLDFLRRRLARIGHILTVDGKKLKSGPPASTSTVTLKFGQDLSEFRPRMSMSSYASEVSVRSWDAKQKKAIIAKATSATAMKPAVGAEATPKNIGSVPVLMSDCRVQTMGEAQSLAQAVLDQHASEYIEAEGRTLGTPKLLAGVTVQSEQVGTRFSGAYLVTSATHRYLPAEGFSTEFSVSGLNSGVIQALFGAEPQPATVGQGVMTAIVTNNNDSEKLGRVKVKFPWLSEEHESGWIRIASPSAGKDYGMVFMPEVNDEVLVGFEHGDFNRPFILGGLWNGVDTPPFAQGVTVKNGKVEQRIVKSRNGHKIELNDSTDKGGILITDKNGNSIELSIQKDTLTITTKGDITIKSGANMSLESTGDMSLKATGNLKLEATGDVTIKATKNLTAEGTMKAEVKGTAGVTIQSPAMTEVKGSVVKLN